MGKSDRLCNNTAHSNQTHITKHLACMSSTSFAKAAGRAEKPSLMELIVQRFGVSEEGTGRRAHQHVAASQVPEAQEAGGAKVRRIPPRILCEGERHV